MATAICWTGRILCGVERWAVDLLLPPRCARCDTDLVPPTPVLLCDGCRESLFNGQERFCRTCGCPRPPQRLQTPCPHCSKTKLHFDSVIPLGNYRGILRDAILTMKHPRGEFLARALGQLLALEKASELADFAPDCLVPVPMYWRRRMWRGVNSPQLLAEELSNHMGVPALRGALWRGRNTIPQKDLGHLDRFRNVRGAFALAGGYGLRDARVLIVDDIMTSGATCSEVAKVLKVGGAAAVTAVVVGRAGITG